MNSRIASLAVVLAACNSSTAPTVDASSSPDLRVGPDMTLTGCHGTFLSKGGAQFLWMYTTCRLTVDSTPNDLTMRIEPQANQGTPPLMPLRMYLTAAPTFKVGHYDLTSLEAGFGTLLEITDMQNGHRYAAQQPDDGTPRTGSISLDLWSLPTATSGLDTTAHGYLAATLEHDPNTPGAATEALVLESYF